MAERGERSLPEQSRKLFEVLQSLHREDDILCANGLPLPHEELLLPAEACCFWQLKAAQNKWQVHDLKKKLAKMKSDAASLTAQQKICWKLRVAIPLTGGNEIEVAYFKDKQQHLDRKILTCGRIAQLRMQLSIDLLLAEVDLLNQYAASATAGTAAPM
jgi:hypothetical protein